MKYQHNLDSFSGPTPLFRTNENGKSYDTFLAIDIERQQIIFQTSLDYTARVRHGVVVRIPIPNNSTDESLRAWIQSNKVQELVDRLIQEVDLKMDSVDGDKEHTSIQYVSSKLIGRSVQTTVSTVALHGHASDEVDLIVSEIEDDAILFLEQTTPVDPRDEWACPKVRNKTVLTKSDAEISSFLNGLDVTWLE